MSMMLTTSLDCLSFRSFVSLWVNHASSVHPSNRLSVCLSVRPSICACVCLSAHPSVPLSLPPFLKTSLFPLSFCPSLCSFVRTPYPIPSPRKFFRELVYHVFFMISIDLYLSLKQSKEIVLLTLRIRRDTVTENQRLAAWGVKGTYHTVPLAHRNCHHSHQLCYTLANPAHTSHLSKKTVARCRLG